jgi:hypothetical protein
MKAIDTLFYGMANLDTSLLYVSSGTVLAANGFVLDNGTTVSPLSVVGAVSPHSFLAGLYAMPHETGQYYAQYDGAINPRHWPRSQAVGLSEI